MLQANRREATALKRIWVLFAVLWTALMLQGCRVRVLTEPELADQVLQQETEAPETEPPETEAAEPETELTETEPTETEPEPTEATEATEETEAETEAAEAVSLPAPTPSGSANAVPVSAPVQQTTEEEVGLGGMLVETAPTVPTEPEPEETTTPGSAPTQETEAEKPTQETEAEAPTEPEAKTYTVTFNGNGGRVKSRESSREVEPGKPYGTMPTPLREGYEFQGWFTQSDGGSQVDAGTIFQQNADQTLYAHWVYDPLAYWSFVLVNRTQQVYLCQQAPVYFELQQDNVTEANCSLIDDTGSFNIASNLPTSVTMDEWVNMNHPKAVIKLVGSMAEAESVKQQLHARFPGAQVFVVTNEGLGSGPAGLYARLALAKALYGDWYVDVDLETVASELGILQIPFA